MDWKRTLATLSPQQRSQLEERLLAEGERFNIFPLSVTQERLWFSERRSSGTSMHHIHGALRIEGRVNAGILSRSFQHLVDRHEILRTTFHQIGNQPRQAIGQPASFSIVLPIIDLCELSASEQEVMVLRLAVEERETPFDLAEGLLLRVALIVVGPAHYVLLFTIHHLICDGWSMNIFLHELSLVYAALDAGRPPVLAPLPIQYADFAVWQRRELQRLINQPTFQSWRAHLGRFDLLLDLPLKGLRPAQRNFQGALHPLRLPADLVEGFRRIAQEEQATLFMVFLAAFQALLYRYTGQCRFAIGTYTANRSHPQLLNLIGDCTNILPLTADLTGDEPSFRALLGRARDQVLEAQQFAAVPVGPLAAAIWPQVDHRQHVLFPVMFNFFQNKASASLNIPGLAVEAIDVPQQQTTMPFDLQFCLWSSGYEHTGYIEYDTDIFAAVTIADLAQHMTALFASIVCDPDSPLSGLALMLPDAYAIRYPMADPAREQPTPAATLPQRLLELARVQPDAVALDDPQRGQWTYAEVARSATIVAHALRSSGVGQAQLVRVGADSIELVAGVAGVLMAGAVCQSVDSTGAELPAGTPMLLLTRRQIAGWIAAGAAPAHIDDCPVAAEQIACELVGASGSKPVLLSHGALAAVLDTYRTACGIGVADRCLRHMAPAGPAALLELLLPLFAGSTLCLAPTDAQIAPELFARLRITLAVLPPAVLADPAWACLPHLRGLILVGDPIALPARLAEQIDGALLFAVGPAGLPFWPLPARLQPDGQVRFSGEHALILSDQLAPLPSGAVGTLFLTGAGMPQQCTGADGTPHFSTGLQARMLARGEIECLGRPEERLTRRGMRVWPCELARLLRAVAGIDDALVMQVGAGTASAERLVAYVILDSNADRAQVVAEIRRRLAQALPAPLRPAALVVLPRWPLNLDGSIARAGLPAPMPADELEGELPGRQGGRLSGAKQELLSKRLKQITAGDQAKPARKGDGCA